MAKTTRVILFIVLAAVLISLQYTPPINPQRRDNGIYAYIGKAVYDGGLPYVDAWDNKLPGIYYINAAAFWLFGVNLWAIWIADTAFVTLAALLMFWVVARLVEDRRLAWIAALLVLMLVRHPALVQDMNFTEPYALLFQALIWVAGWAFLQQPNLRAGFVIGFASGAALLLKQTTVGAAFALIPAIWISRHPVWFAPSRWRYLASMVAGGVFCLGLMALVLAAQGILDDALASFRDAGEFHDWVGYGTPWIGLTMWHTLIEYDVLLAYGPLLPFWLAGVRWAFQNVRGLRPVDRASVTRATLAIWAVGAFAINFALANVTDRAYEHYYIPLIPSVVILTVLGLSTTYQNKKWAWRYMFALLILIPLGSSVGRLVVAGFNAADPKHAERIIAYVVDHTEPGDLVWVWGANTRINFQSGRSSPTQYIHAYPLLAPGEKSEARIAEVIADLNAHPPRLIVDSTLVDGRRVPPLDPVRRARWWKLGGRRDVANLTPIYQYVAERCTMVEELEQVALYHCAE